MDLNEFSGRLPWESEYKTVDLPAVRIGDLIDPKTSGLILAFGIHTGGWLKSVCMVTKPKTVFGFDSFQGLPEDWGRFKKGTWALSDGVVASINWPVNSKLVIGWFADTLPGFMKEYPGPVAYAHINVGLYASAKDVLDNIGPRIGVGSILHFGAIRQIQGGCDEIRAFNELLERDDKMVWEVIGRTGGTDAIFRVKHKWL